MTTHPALAALPWTSQEGSADHQLLRALLVRDHIHFMDSGADPQTFDPADSDAGTVVPVIAFSGKLFWYDSADGSTDHDGVSTLVCAGGQRYKIEGANYLVRFVKDKDLTAPPGSPVIGDTYLVAAAATGDWTGKDDRIAIYTARGWEFILGAKGQLLYVEDEAGYYHFDGAAWVQGLGAAALPVSSVAASHLIGARTHWIVEDQTTNTPPVAGQGIAFIVGPSPTGAWAGHAGKIAVRETAGSSDDYVIYPPEIGARAHDRAQGRDFIWTGSAWQSASGRWTMKVHAFTSSGNFTKDARCFGVLVQLVGGGGGIGSINSGVGGTTSFGSHCSATGGGQENAGPVNSGGTPGTGSIATGIGAVLGAGNNRLIVTDGGYGYVPGEPGLKFADYGRGASGVGTLGMGGAGGGVIDWIDAEDLDAITAVTVGAGGAAGLSGAAGNPGIALIYEYIEV